MSVQRLFISHANEDDAVAKRIVAYLEARGVPCWISSRDIPPRSIYADAITEAMQVASACAVIVSKSSNASKAVKRELELASHYERPLIPIRIDGSEPAPGVDYYLRNVQWMDYKRDGDHALDRIVAHITNNPAPISSPRRSPGGGGLISVVAALALIGVVSAGGWYAWSHSRPQPPVQTAAVSAEVLAPLLGAYNWQGLECGSGPTVTYEDSALVFTMPDAPIYRHEVLSATPASGGFALEVRSRVVAPQDHAGETYTLGLNGNALQVSTDERNDTWTRCEVAAASEASHAPAATSPAATPQAGLAGSRWWGSYTTRLGVTTEIGWRLNADGSACWVNSRGEVGGCDYYRWIAEGNRLTLFQTGNPPHWVGTVSGSTYSGTITDSSENSPFSFTQRRQPD